MEKKPENLSLIEAKKHKIKIRKLNIDDWEDYKKIRIQSLETDPDSFEKSEKGIIKTLTLDSAYWGNLLSGNNENITIFGLYDNENLIATASISLEKDDGYDLSYIYEGNTRPTIDRVYVDLNYRDRKLGLGTMIMRQVINEARNKGFPYVFLDVNENSEVAIGFYTKLGFLLSGKVFISKEQSTLSLVGSTNTTQNIVLNNDGTEKKFLEMRLSLI